MNVMKTLGTYISNVQPKAVPNCCIGEVINRGAGLSSVKKHADYVNTKGDYEIVERLTDHHEDFKYLYNVYVGKLSLQIKTEMESEYIFGQAGRRLHPNLSIIAAETF